MVQQLVSFLKRYRWWLMALAVLVLATGVRLYQLGQVPHGMTWDEAAIGYNGYAVMVERRDEWLIKLPLSFKSFGDFKAPLAIYITGIFVFLLSHLFGMQLWIVRLPFALAGIGSVLGMMMLAAALWEEPEQSENTQKETVAGTMASFKNRLGRALCGPVVLAGCLLAISPWHIHFSRVGFESGLALFFMIWGVACGCWWWRTTAFSLKLDFSSWLWVSSIVFLAAAMYSYHSAKVAVPLLLLVGVLVSRAVGWSRRQFLWIGAGLAMALVLLSPLVFDAVKGRGNERFNQATIFNTAHLEKVQDGRIKLVTTLTHNYVLHLSPAFLVGGQTETLRHSDGKHGVLDQVSFVLIGLVMVLVVLNGIAIVLRRFGVALGTLSTKISFTTQEWNKVWLGLGWVTTGISPAALGIDVPHSNRALLALPGFIILAVVGCDWLVRFIKKQSLNKTINGTHGERNIILKGVIGIFILWAAAYFLQYQWYYYSVFAATSANDFKDGYLEAFEYVIPYERGLAGKSKVDQVVFTTDYGQAYIYALFARRTKPSWYQHGSLNTYLFTDQINEGDLSRPNTVVVASQWDTVPKQQAQKIIFGSDGLPRFYVFVNPKAAVEN